MDSVFNDGLKLFVSHGELWLFFEELVCSSEWLNLCVSSYDSIRLLFLLMSAGCVATAIVSSLVLVVSFAFFFSPLLVSATKLQVCPFYWSFHKTNSLFHWYVPIFCFHLLFPSCFGFILLFFFFFWGSWG